MKANFGCLNTIDVDLPLGFCQAEKSRDQRALSSTSSTHNANLIYKKATCRICQEPAFGLQFLPSHWAGNWSWYLWGREAHLGCRTGSRGWKSPDLCWANRQVAPVEISRVLRSWAPCTPPPAPLRSSKSHIPGYNYALCRFWLFDLHFSPCFPPLHFVSLSTGNFPPVSQRRSAPDPPLLRPGLTNRYHWCKKLTKVALLSKTLFLFLTFLK